MRILLVNQFYLPDVAPTGRVLHDVARELVRRGHDVTVLCSQCSYDGRQRYPPREIIDGVHVRRITAMGTGRPSVLWKFFDYACFVLRLVFELATMRPTPDLIMALTTPPHVGLLARIAADFRRCRHAHWIMDAYPDVMVAHLMIRPFSRTHRFLGNLTYWELKGSSLTITLGPDMAARVDRYIRHPSRVPGGEFTRTGPPVQWVPLWVDGEMAPWPKETVNPLRLERGWAPDELVLMYSGNMGLGHCFADFMEAAVRLRDNRRVRWVFAGGGIRRRDIERFLEKHEGLNVHILPYVDSASLRAHLCSADVHLASLEQAWSGCMIPSKIQGIFGVGRPVIFVGAQDSSIARWTVESGGGWVVRENDMDALLRAVSEAADPAERERRGAAAHAYAALHFDLATNCNRICQLVEAIPAI